MIMSPAHTHRWIQTSDQPSEHTHEFDPCKTSLIGTTINSEHAEQQLRHADQQLELQKQYPGRHPRRN
jgi:hypothetical protein